MVFVILACTDIFGEKINVELPFTEPLASLNELYRALEHVFCFEEGHMRQTKMEGPRRVSEPFTVSRVQRYSDDRHMWVGINDVRDVQEHDQLYVFRKNATRTDISKQREIPPPRSTPYLQTFYAASSTMNPEGKVCANFTETAKASLYSPPFMTRQSEFPATFRTSGQNHLDGMDHNSPTRFRGYSTCVTDNGATALTVECSRNNVFSHTVCPSVEEMDAVFRIGDSDQKGYLTARDFQRVFCFCQIEFSSDVVEELYRGFAKEKEVEPVMSFQDFCNYAREFVQTVGVAYTRLRTQERQKVIEQEQRESAAVVAELQMEKTTLVERLKTVQKQLAEEQERQSRLRDEANELGRARDPEYCEQEQRLLDKEVSVFRHRQRLRQEEMDYERLAVERQRRIPNVALKEISSGNGL